MATAKPLNIIDILKWMGLIKTFIGPAVEIVEALKEAFKSKEQKFIDLALKLFDDENAAEEAQRIVAECIIKLQLALPCLDIQQPSQVIDCFCDHVNKLRSKKLRNGIYKSLAIELARINAPDKYKKLPESKWDQLTEWAYNDKKTRKGFKVRNGEKG